MAGIHCPACHQGYINSLNPRCLHRPADTGRPERKISGPSLSAARPRHDRIQRRNARLSRSAYYLRRRLIDWDLTTPRWTSSGFLLEVLHFLGATISGTLEACLERACDAGVTQNLPTLTKLTSLTLHGVSFSNKLSVCNAAPRIRYRSDCHKVPLSPPAQTVSSTGTWL